MKKKNYSDEQIARIWTLLGGQFSTLIDTLFLADESGVIVHRGGHCRLSS